MTCLRISVLSSNLGLKVFTFFPLAVVIDAADCSNSHAASAPILSLRASTVVFMFACFTPSTSWAFLQDFQPLRKYAQSIFIFIPIIYS
jgi:hypothetical protein